MKVILLQDVKALGRRGDVKEVADGYARNFLFRKQLAQPADKANMNSLQHEKQLQSQRDEKQLEQAKKQAEELAEKTVVVFAKAGEAGRLFGSVTTADISDSLAAIGYSVDKRKIETETAIKTLGRFDVTLKLHGNVQASIVVEVRDESER